MILLCGIPSETPLALVRDALDELGAPYTMLNQRAFADIAIELEIDGARVGGSLRLRGDQVPLEDVTAVYTRLMDDRLLPEVRDEPEGSRLRRHCRALHETLMRWCEVSPALIVNRAGPMASNFSKPYQAQLIAEHGLSVPETLITNDPELVKEFQRRHGRVVYKSASGVRSIVRELEPGDADRLERIRWCPTQFQQFVDGTHIRVHVVADVVHATALESDVVDYRYASKDGGETPVLRAVELPAVLADRCVALAAGLELPFAGIDLKLAESGEVYCFEVNPCPAFSYYELSTGQQIARTLAQYLADAA